MSEIQVVLDERLRLITAVLAASNWPTVEQVDRPHAVHTHSKQTMQFVAPHSDHPAVQFVNQAVADGGSLNSLLDIALCCEWASFAIQHPLPAIDGAAEWVAALAEFANVTEISTFWAEHDAVWQTAVSECTTIFENCPLPTMLAQMTGKAKQLQLMPTLVFPMLDPIIGKTAETSTILLPPPKAWGESPPWPYKEDPIWVVVGAAKGLIANAIAPLVSELTPEQQATVAQAGVALCLEQLFDDFERQAYIVRIKKEESLAELPRITDKLRDWFAGDMERPLTAVFDK